jgi:RNA polymerase sigma-70 factor (ECF subfamily)
MRNHNEYLVEWFNRLVESYYARLCDFSFFVVHSKELAEEVVDDVFMKVWDRVDEVYHIENIAAYLFRAVKNTSLNYLESKYRHPVDFFDNLSEVSVSVEVKTPEEEMISEELGAAVSSAIQALPEKCKLIFLLAKENGLKYREIADILGLSEKTVENQISIALKKISEQLQKGNFISKIRNKGSSGFLSSILFMFF